MKTRLINLWDELRTSFWFVPFSMSLTALLLALGLPHVDRWIAPDSVDDFRPWLSMSPEAAQATLSSIAGAMVTCAGVVFSVTIAALSIAASQFGSRIIRSFRNDLVTHFTLGAFVASSLYAFTLLASLRSTDLEVPQLSIVVAMAMAVGALMLLIYFIHHTATSIQSDHLIKVSSRELNAAVERMFPDGEGTLATASHAKSQLDQLDTPQDIEARVEGYLQALDGEGLLVLAEEHDMTFEVLCQPGDFLTFDVPIVKAWPASEIAESMEESINGCFITGDERTPRQDIVYALDELVEVAVRALSPGINDPFTAARCIDRIAAAMARVAARPPLSRFHLDDAACLRLITHPVNLSQLLHQAFDQLRYESRGNLVITMRLLAAMETISTRFHQKHADDCREALLFHADMVLRSAKKSLHEESDIERATNLHDRVRDAVSSANGLKNKEEPGENSHFDKDGTRECGENESS